MKNNTDKVPSVKKQQESSSKGPWIFMGFSLLLLAVAFFSNPDKGTQSLQFLLHLLGTILPVFVLVFVIMVLINLFLKTQLLIKYMGKGSGLKGWAIAVVTGILSVGAIYMWFPVLKEMIDKGVKHGLIAVFLYNRGIKLQWMPVLALYFSVKYIVVLTLVMLLASLVQGLIIEQLFKNGKSKT